MHIFLILCGIYVAEIATFVFINCRRAFRMHGRVLGFPNFFVLNDTNSQNITENYQRSLKSIAHASGKALFALIAIAIS